MKRYLYYLKHVLSYAMLALGIYYMNSVRWVGDGFVFLTWLFAYIYVFMYLTRKTPPKGDETLKKLLSSYRAGYHFPIRVDNWIYAGLALFVACMGHYVLGIVWIIIGGCDTGLHKFALEQPDIHFDPKTKVEDN